MAVAIVSVTGGVDTHADVHVAAAVDHNGGLLGVESFRADQAGFEELQFDLPVWDVQRRAAFRSGEPLLVESLC